MCKLIINETMNKSNGNKKYYQKSPHIQLKTALELASLYKINNGSL